MEEQTSLDPSPAVQKSSQIWLNDDELVWQKGNHEETIFMGELAKIWVVAEPHDCQAASQVQGRNEYCASDETESKKKFGLIPQPHQLLNAWMW